jgi:hypothetical protein
MVKLHILCNPSFFSLLVTSLLRNAPVDLPSLCLKRRRLPQGSAFWRSHRWKIFFRGSTPSPEFSKGILHANRKSRITFERWEIDAKFQNRPIPNWVKESIGDVTSGLARPLAAEIVFLPFSAITKALIASKRYKIDGKCQQNTNRKPWSLYQQVNSFPVSNAP